MEKLFTLLKVDLVRTLSLNKLKLSKSIYKNIGIFIVALFIATSLISSIAGYTYLGVNFLSKYGLEQFLLPIIYFICGFTTFYTTIYKAKAYLFSCEDNLFAMPVKSSTILTSRVITLLVFNSIATTLICIPSFITYGIMLKLGLSYYIYAFLGYLFMPIVPTILGAIFGYMIAYFTSKVNNKKMFETIFTFAVVLLIMYASFNIQTLAMKFVNNVELINKMLNNVGFLLNSFMKMVVNYSIKDTLIYIGTNILSVFLFIGIFNISYMKILQKLKVEGTKNKYIEKEHENKGTLSTLISKEIRMYFSIPVYIFNTAFGGVLLLFASISTMFYDKDSLFKMMEVEPGTLPINVLVLGITVFMIAASNTTACSISIEGKNFWILKTMPIDVMKIFLSKIILNLLVAIPMTVISIILFAISFKLTIMQVISTIMMAVIFSLACSMFGIIANLKFPRLDFVSYTQVVKQSFSTFVGIIVPIVLVFASSAAYFALNMSIDKYLLIIFALLLGIIMVQYNILKKWGIKKFNEIN